LGSIQTTLGRIFFLVVGGRGVVWGWQGVVVAPPPNNVEKKIIHPMTFDYTGGSFLKECFLGVRGISIKGASDFPALFKKRSEIKLTELRNF
jgi:hypothetical protein